MGGKRGRYVDIMSIVLPANESELTTKHCRYVVPTEIKLRPTIDDEMKNLFRNGKTATVTADY
jgi:hypothetical protein